MSFINALKSEVVSLFKSFADRPECLAIAAHFESIDVDFGFPRNGNITTYKTGIEALRGEPSKRVSLDRLSNGKPVCIVQRMQADSVEDCYASAVHGAILAWRDANAPLTKDGKKRLIDDAFTAAAQYVGLIKVADRRKVVKDGNETTAKVNDSTARVWFGLSANLRERCAKFAASAPEMPAAYVGTEENSRIGTLLIPVTITTASGEKIKVLARIPSWTASINRIAAGKSTVNDSRAEFERLSNNPDVAFDVKNKSFKIISALVATDVAREEAEKAAAAEKAAKRKPAKPAKPIPPPAESEEAA